MKLLSTRTVVGAITNTRRMPTFNLPPFVRLVSLLPGKLTAKGTSLYIVLFVSSPEPEILGVLL